MSNFLIWNKFLILRTNQQKSFPQALRACWLKINAKFKNNLSEFGLTPDQYSVLRWLYENKMNPLCQKDLKRLMFTDANNIANLVGRMEKAGLIIRHCCLKDKRRNLLALSLKGEDFLKKTKSVATRITHDAFAGMSRAEKEKMLYLLKQVCTKIHSA